MRTQDVLFNESGRSIESSCLIFINKKWKHAYVLCSQPSDLRNVFITVYKSHKHRLKSKQLFMLTCDSFVGYQSGFLLKKERNTLCVLTQKDVLIAAFSTVENLICWESWLHQACCKGAMVYAQLIEAPAESRAHEMLHREVSLHVHDGRLAMVEGRPQRVLGFWHLNDVTGIRFSQNMMYLTSEGGASDPGTYSFSCGQFQQLVRYMQLASKPGALIKYLHRKTADGPWTSGNTLRVCNSYPAETSYMERMQLDSMSVRNQAATPNDDSIYGQIKGTARWTMAAGDEAQPSFSLAKSETSVIEASDFVTSIRDSREPISASVAPLCSTGGSSHTIGLEHAVFTSPSTPLYMNFDANPGSSTKCNCPQESTSYDPPGSWILVDDNTDYVNYVNVASSTSISKPAECSIRRAASDMPNYVNVTASPSVNSFSTDMLAGRFPAYGGAAAPNQYTPKASASFQMFSSEFSLSSASAQDSSQRRYPQPVTRENSSPGASRCSRRLVCRAGSWPKHVYRMGESTPNFRNFSTCSIGANGFAFGSGRVGLRSSNAQLPSTNIVDSPGEPERKAPGTSECRGKYLRQHQKVTRSRGRDAASFRDKSFNRISQHQRSRSVGLEATVKRCGSTREENWDRAKRIIGGVRKSVNGSRTAIQSASLDKLVSLPHAVSRSGLSHCEALNEASSSPAAEKIPKLDIAVNADATQSSVLPSAPIEGPSPLPGLVKLPQERFGLKKMGNILTKSLRKSVTGSYSKYDGERATHHYNLGDVKESPLPPVVDCIESAVNKGRARLIEADRRNSSFAEGIRSTHVNSPTPRRYTFSQQMDGTLKPCAVAARINREEHSSGDADAFYLHCNQSTSNYTMSPPTARVSPLVSSAIRVYDTIDSPPPRPPKTYLKNKQAAAAALMVAESCAAQKEQTPVMGTVTPLQGNYCAMFACEPAAIGSRKTSREDMHTLYTQIDPVATLAATQTQADMMKERERQGTGRLLAHNAYVSDRALFARKKKLQPTDDRSNGTKGFFARRIWRKPSKSRSHCHLRF